MQEHIKVCRGLLLAYIATFGDDITYQHVHALAFATCARMGWPAEMGDIEAVEYIASDVFGSLCAGVDGFGARSLPVLERVYERLTAQKG